MYNSNFDTYDIPPGLYEVSGYDYTLDFLEKK